MIWIVNCLDVIVIKRKSPPKDFCNYQAHKFGEFKKFYEDFYKSENFVFNPDKAICNMVFSEELNILFLGVNTIYLDSYREEDHWGKINYNALEQELQDVRNKYPEANIITLMHHSPSSQTINNWEDVLFLFKMHRVYSFIGGHTHTSEGVTATTKETVNIVTCGSLSASEEKVRSAFLILKYNNENGIRKLDIMPYNYEEDYNASNKYWQKQESKPNIMESIIIK